MLAWGMEPVLARTDPTPGKAQRDTRYGAMPIFFIPNQGQLDERVAYAIQGKDKSVYFTPEGLTFVLTEREKGLPASERRFLREIGPAEAGQQAPGRRWAVKLDFVGVRRDVRPESLALSETMVSYFKGRPEEWKTGLRTSSKIIYRDLWPGIDLIYYGTVNRLKYDFIVRPGADPAQIKLAYRGADSVEVTKEGRLEVATPLGVFQDEIPVAWQEMGGEKLAVSVTYALAAAPKAQLAGLSLTANDSLVAPMIDPQRQGHVYGFTVGRYDRSRTLVLDPEMLIYCGFIGGSGIDRGNGIAVDGTGNAYVTGDTQSTADTFPETAGPYLSYNGSTDAFVAKVNAGGTALDYCGYIGGSGTDYGYGIAVDGAGHAYVTGYTYSAADTFPVTVGPDMIYSASADAFVAKVNTSGTALDYCGYIGGLGSDIGYGIAVDGAGNAYVTGLTGSYPAHGFPVTVGPNLNHNGGTFDAFVAKVKADGTALDYCGYIGGAGSDQGNGIAVDGAGNAYVTGGTESTEATFPVTVGPDLFHNGGTNDAFVAKVKADGTVLDYCGYIGGSDTDSGKGIAVDVAGNAYVTGFTRSTEATFPVTVGPDRFYNGGVYDAFVAKVNAGGATLDYCGYIGGSSMDIGYGIAVDGAGNAYVTGHTYSTEATFPVTVGPYLSNRGNQDAFAAKVNAGGSSLVYCGFIGGSGMDYGNGIAVDSAGNAYVTGYTDSTEATFPVTVGPYTTNNGNTDAFVAKIARTIGTVVINPEPDSINAPWTLTGPYSYSQSGTGDQTLSDLPTGDYTLAWEDVSGWTKPTPASETKAVASGGTTTFAGTYVQQVGTVVINPEPDSINVPWTLTGPYSYSQSGTGDQTLNSLPIGDYTIAWGDVPGWTKPAGETKEVTNGGSTTFAGTYTDAGIPQIQITPSTLNFGYVPPGSYKDLILTVKNIGTGTLTGTVSVSPPFSIVSGGNYSLGWNQTQTVVVRYTAPLEEGAQTGSLTFTGGGGGTVQVKGTNVKPLGLPWLQLLLGD